MLNYDWFDLGSTYSFAASRIVNKLNLDISMLERGIVVSISLGESVDIKYVCTRCVVSVGGKTMRINLIPLKIYDFDIILEMDWLSVYRSLMDCFMKVMTFLGDDGKEVTYRGK